MNHLSELNEINKQFCDGAEFLRLHVRKENGDEFWTKDKYSYQDIGNGTEVYRSVTYANGKELLFVIDIDYYGKDLERPYEVAREINSRFPDMFFSKFSGHKGFHMISRIDRTTKEWLNHKAERKPYEDIQEYFRHILYRISENVPGTTVDQERAKQHDLVWLDITMYRQNRLIRSMCQHLGSGMYSVPVDLNTDSLDEILERAKLNTPLGISRIELPEFQLYEMADSKDKDKIAKRLPKKIDEGKFREMDKRYKDLKRPDRIVPDKFPPCVKKLLSIQLPYHPSHVESVFLCSWLARHSYSKDEIQEIFKDLMGPDKYDEKTTKQQTDFIVDKDYRYASCKKVKEEYGLCEKSCKWYKKNFPEGR